ncbi:hypothetical protein M9H77_28179 [Catharanthus roseus]|uniref:Uncharacterized protein n=1 Tax=Catharanthus roseus TaxID=4058 RepID=A0ACC0AIQ7_CATRO|nr:hypothetical protein M9H77_28179 [Catharanthus roseus]
MAKSQMFLAIVCCFLLIAATGKHFIFCLHSRRWKWVKLNVVQGEARHGLEEYASKPKLATVSVVIGRELSKEHVTKVALDFLVSVIIIVDFYNTYAMVCFFFHSRQMEVVITIAAARRCSRLLPVAAATHPLLERPLRGFRGEASVHSGKFQSEKKKEVDSKEEEEAFEQLMPYHPRSIAASLIRVKGDRPQNVKAIMLLRPLGGNF